MLFEQRARAFAAELLLPAAVAGAAFRDAKASEVAQAVKALQTKYKVSSEVVAWQARNSGADLDPRTKLKLRGYVSEPMRF